MTSEGRARSGRSARGTAYAIAGDGDPIVLVHGVGMRGEIWAPQVETLSRTRRTVVYDLLGHGDSAMPPPRPTLGDYAAQLIELLDHLGIERADVVGHSMGALVALEFALAHPVRTARVAALNAVYRRTPEQLEAVQARLARLRADGVGPTMAPTLARWFGDPVPDRLRGAMARTALCLGAARQEGYARSYGLFAEADGAHAGRLAGLSMPALFVAGALDANSTPAMSQAMAQESGGAFELIEGAGHMMALTHPEAVDACLARWLDRPLHP